MEDQNMENEIILNDDIDAEINNEEVIEVNNNDDTVVEQNAEEVTSDAKTYSEEDVERIRNEIKQEYEANSDKIFNARWAREKSKFERENAPLYQIENVLKGQLGATDRNDLVKKLGDFYDVDITNKTTGLNEREERILARADAEEIKELGINEMVNEANRIASIPEAKRTIRDNVVFSTLAQEITEQRNKNDLKEKGYDLTILDNQEFKDFRSKLNYKTPIADAVDMYNLITKGKSVEVQKPKPTKPASAGSTKSNVGPNNTVKEFYTYEESKQFTREDYNNNPALFEAVKNSMTKW